MFVFVCFWIFFFGGWGLQLMNVLFLGNFNGRGFAFSPTLNLRSFCLSVRMIAGEAVEPLFFF